MYLKTTVFCVFYFILDDSMLIIYRYLFEKKKNFSYTSALPNLNS